MEVPASTIVSREWHWRIIRSTLMLFWAFLALGFGSVVLSFVAYDEGIELVIRVLSATAFALATGGVLQFAYIRYTSVAFWALILLTLFLALICLIIIPIQVINPDYWTSFIKVVLLLALVLHLLLLRRVWNVRRQLLSK